MSDLNQETYLYIRKFLKKYNFDLKPSFTILYDDFPNYNNPLPFKRFVNLCKGMGVSSVVERGADGLAERFLRYDKSNDKYLFELFPSIAKCPTCAGTGVVEAK